MVKEIIGDIFQSEVNVIIHQANCYHTMGGGIAKVIADNYPEAKDADDKTPIGEKKLGSYSFAFVDSGKKLIFNMYSQGKYGRGKRFTDYDAMISGFEAIKKFLESDEFKKYLDYYDDDNLIYSNNIQDFQKSIVLGVPYLIGCGLAGGDWKVVENIINMSFKDFKYPLVIVKLPQYASDATNSAPEEKLIV